MNTEQKHRIAQLLYMAQDGRCAHCSTKLIHPELARQAANAMPDQRLPDYPSLDRIKPGARGGRYTISNLLLACQDCNEQRGSEYGLTCRAYKMHKRVLKWLRDREFLPKGTGSAQ